MICPTCKRKLSLETREKRPFGPFCSSRCRLADLGSWLDGAHRISSPVSEEDLDQGGGTGNDDDDPSTGLH